MLKLQLQLFGGRGASLGYGERGLAYERERYGRELKKEIKNVEGLLKRKMSNEDRGYWQKKLTELKSEQAANADTLDYARDYESYMRRGNGGTRGRSRRR